MVVNVSHQQPLADFYTSVRYKSIAKSLLKPVRAYLSKPNEDWINHEFTDFDHVVR